MASMKDITGKVRTRNERRGAEAATDERQASVSSVRAKTTAFLGKMLGTSTTRERAVSAVFLRSMR